MISKIFPLFKPDDYELGAEYLARSFIESGAVQIMMDDPIEDPEERKKITHDIGIDVCHRLYGINIPLMANFLRVQTIFIEKFQYNLLNYMGLVGLKGEYVNWTPAAYTVPLLINMAKNNKDKSLKNFDPGTLWDPYRLDGFELTNPLNSFLHLNLILRDIKNTEFLKDLHNNGIISKDIYNNTPNAIMLKILPDNNFNKILSIQKAIFKHY